MNNHSSENYPPAEEHFDALVIGSGFGGSVMAYRLAEAGLRVGVLERGKPYPPGSFPRNPNGLKDNFWDPDRQRYGMFDIWSFRGIAAITASGLGGGSLVYANVLIRKDEKWFVKEDLTKGGHEYWPVTRADLDRHYQHAEQMLNAQPYPFAHAPYNQTPKTQAFQAAAAQVGLPWSLPNLAVTFANPGAAPVTGEPIHEAHPNLHNRTRYTCRLCGECDVGCNYGSKNTLDYTYLSAAQRHGAELKTLCKARAFQPREGGGYTIYYVHYDLESGQTTPHTATANQLILSAGTLGSTHLLLKLRQQDLLPHLSPTLGTHFSGNGDLIGFVTGTNRVIDGSYGPVITSTTRMADALDGGEGRGFYLQEAGYPNFINWMLEMLQAPQLFWKQRLFLTHLVCSMIHGMGLADSNLSQEVADLFGSSPISSRFMPLLGMGRDIPDGVMRLRRDRKGQQWLDIDWHKNTTPASRDYFDRLRRTMEDIAQALGTKLIEPNTRYLNRTIAAHPLGGCPMGRNDQEGVVDDHGEVFNYPGFFIADGSVMPGPVGPNPSLTIAALADRFAERVIDNHTHARKGSR